MIAATLFARHNSAVRATQNMPAADAQATREMALALTECFGAGNPGGLGACGALCFMLVRLVPAAAVFFAVLSALHFVAAAPQAAGHVRDDESVASSAGAFAKQMLMATAGNVRPNHRAELHPCAGPKQTAAKGAALGGILD
eukprot:6363683-Amphidinium_carterae.1